MSLRRTWGLRVAVLVLVLAATGAGIAWWMHGRQRAAVWARAIPARPDLAGWPEELVNRLAAAERAARENEDVDHGLAVLARLYHANGFSREALQCYAALEVLEPDNAHENYSLAHLLAGAGRLEEAVPRLRRVMALAPEYIPARLRLGDALLKMNDVDGAREAFRGVLARNARKVHAILGQARCATARGQWTEARDFLQQALAIDPDFHGAIMLLVTVSEHLGDENTARRLRARGIQEYVDFRDPWVEELWPDCYDAYRLSVAAAVAGAAGDFAATERWLERAMRFAPDEAAYPRQLGRLYLQQKKYNSARPLLEQAVRLNPRDTEAWAPLIELLGIVGDRDARDQAIADGLAQNPESAAMHHANGARLARAGRTEEAIAEFKRAAALKPDEVRAYVDLAALLFRLNRIEEGVAELRQALVAEPGHPLATSMLARHEIFSGHPDEARRWIDQLETVGRVSAADLATIRAEFRRQFGQDP